MSLFFNKTLNLVLKAYSNTKDSDFIKTASIALTSNVNITL